MQNAPQTFELFDLEKFDHKKLFIKSDQVWCALGNISTYLEKSQLGSHRGTISPQAYLVNPDEISIGIGTVVEPGAYIKGPCIIGDYCTIRHGAYIRGNVITGDHCVIGHCTEVKNSILLQNAQVAHFAYVGDSIIGSHVNLGAGVKLANLLFNHKNIEIQLEGRMIDTERKKLGAIIGDRAQIGCNSVTNPGTILSKNTRIYPCINVGGVVLENFTIKTSAESISFSQKNYAFS